MTQQPTTPSSKPLTYSIRLAVKTPSTSVQYRMLEADVTVSGEDELDVLRQKAQEALALSLVDVAVLMGESPPEDIRPTLEEIYDPGTIAGLYPNSSVDGTPRSFMR